MPSAAIPLSRARLQSRALVWTAGAAFALLLFPAARYASLPPTCAVEILALSILFALAAWSLRAATAPAALFGGAICLFVTLFTTEVASRSPLRTGLVPLLLLFVLTFTATRLGRERKSRAGLAESRKGRNAAQVLANLGTAALAASAPHVLLSRWLQFPTTAIHSAPPGALPMLAALVEATADTVASEIGQAFGGTPRLLLTLRSVPPGTDGAITFTGTLSGIAAGALIAASGIPTLGFTMGDAAIALGAGTAGLFIDTLLGATLERRGYINNDLVNLSSTAAAALLAALVTLAI